ncbi:hypothetical protein Pfo_010779 [Paulownia fortunei]|nr:hypothetical protein Pfo_010779 [Paulownia fortunei]
MNAPPIPGKISAGGANVSIQHQNLSTMANHKNRASPDALNNLHTSEDVEVQTSIASSPVERLQDGGASSTMEGTNVLPLFPTSPAINAPNSSPPPPKPEHSTQVIKVVPHNARSATESAARIFRSIQEERKHCFITANNLIADKNAPEEEILSVVDVPKGKNGMCYWNRS